MAGLVPAIHVKNLSVQEDLDARDIQCKDALRAFARA
jgi:hypothetical protein